MGWIIDEGGKVVASARFSHWLSWFFEADPHEAIVFDGPLFVWPGVPQRAMVAVFVKDGLVTKVLDLDPPWPKMVLLSETAVVLPRSALAYRQIGVGQHLEIRN
jgi:hypothetical protein